MDPPCRGCTLAQRPIVGRGGRSSVDPKAYAQMGLILMELRRIAGRLRRALFAWLRRAWRLWPTRLRLLRSGLPPLARGRCPLEDRAFRTDDTFLMKEARRFGPVFKTMISGAVVTCVTDHRRSRILLKEHAGPLGPPDSPYSALVPGGFLRTLTGDSHGRMRRIFVRAVRPVLIDANEPELRELVLDVLADLAAQGAAAG